MGDHTRKGLTTLVLQLKRIIRSDIRPIDGQYA
jgi:hypothetical protein